MKPMKKNKAMTPVLRIQARRKNHCHLKTQYASPWNIFGKSFRYVYKKGFLFYSELSSAKYIRSSNSLFFTHHFNSIGKRGTTWKRR